MTDSRYIQFAKPYDFNYRTNGRGGATISGTSRAEGLIIAPESTGRNYTSDEVGGPTVTRHINALHPDVRNRYEAALADIRSAGIRVHFPNGDMSGYRSSAQQGAVDPRHTGAEAGTSFHNFGLALDVTPVNATDHARVRGIMRSHGLYNGDDVTTVGGRPAYATRMMQFQNARDPHHYQTSPRWQDAYALAALPQVTVDGRSYPLIPGGELWQRRATPEHQAAVRERFGIDVPLGPEAARVITPFNAATTPAPAASMGTTAPQPQAAVTGQPAPASFRITDDINQPHVRQSVDRLRAYHNALPEARRNPALSTTDAAYFNDPANRQALLMHFKHDQNAHAAGTFDVNNPQQQPAIGPKVTTALSAAEASRTQAPHTTTAPTAPAQPQAPAATQRPAAPAPAASPAPAAPSTAPLPPRRPDDLDASRPEPTGLIPRPTGRQTPEQAAERHAENGLRVLGITREGMSAEERTAALRTYAQGAGLPEGATPDQIRTQVRTDVTALQTKLRDVSREQATQGRYALGQFGTTRDGVDGIAGAYTNGAIRRFQQDNPDTPVIALVRPAQPAAPAIAAAPAPTASSPSPRDAAMADLERRAGQESMSPGEFLRRRIELGERFPLTRTPSAPAPASTPISPVAQAQIAPLLESIRSVRNDDPLESPTTQRDLQQQIASAGGALRSTQTDGLDHREASAATTPASSGKTIQRT